MKHIIYILLLGVGIILTGCQQSELIDQDEQQAKSRVVTVRAGIPGNDASTRLSTAPDGETPHGIELKWENDDVLMFNFEYDGNYYAKDAPIITSSISENGRYADFSLEIPTDIPDGAQFNLYAVYQDNKGIHSSQHGVFLDNLNEFEMIIYEIDKVTLTDNRYRVRPMMWWKQENIVNTEAPEIGTLQLQHAGWMIALHLKNNSEEDMAVPSTVIFESHMNNLWLWNGYTAELPTFNPRTEEFTIYKNLKQRQLLFVLAEYDWNPYYNKTITAGETLTVYRWVVSDGESAPTLQVNVANADTNIVLPAREVKNGNIYHVYMEWDGSEYTGDAPL